MLILVLQQCHKESEDRWKRLSRQVADILLPMLAKQQVGRAGVGLSFTLGSIAHSSVRAGPGTGELPFLSELLPLLSPLSSVGPGPREVVSPLIPRRADIFLLFTEEGVGEGQPVWEEGQGRRPGLLSQGGAGSPGC